MIIRRFIRTDSTTFPGKCISVIELDSGDSGGENLASVANTLRGDAKSLDAVAVCARDWNMIGDRELHDLLISLKPLCIACVLMARGDQPDRIDDIMGSGYIDVLDLIVDGNVNENQVQCLDVVRRYGYRFVVTIDLVPGVTTVDSVADLAEMSRGCELFIMHPVDPRKDGEGKAAKPFRKKDLGSMLDAVKGKVRNPRLV